MTVAVVVDSAASIPADLAAARGLTVVPLQVVVDDSARAEGVGIDAGEVLAHLVAGDHVTTSQPTPAAFDAALATAAMGGATGVVVVTLSGTLSGTADVARAAAARADLPVEVVDTRTVAMAEGLAALAATGAAAAGASLDEVARVARDTAAGARCFFTVDGLDHLRRGGRIGPAVATVGRVLGIRPVLEMVEGEVRLVARVRSTVRARAALVEMAEAAVRECVRPAVAAMGVGDDAAVEEAASALEERFPGLSALRTGVSAVLAVHTGPGTLAVAVADLGADRGEATPGV